MKKAIEMKLLEYESKIKQIEETHPHYWLRADWKACNEVRTVLAEVLQAG